MKLTRREALSVGMATATAMATRDSFGAVSPAKGAHTINAHLKLGCAAYSFRDYLPRGEKKGEMTLFDWLDLAAEWDLDGVELTSYYFTSEEPKYMNDLKAKAFRLGLDVSATSVGNTFCLASAEDRAKQVADVKRWIDHSVELGSPCLRVFAGGKPKDGEPKRDFGFVVECLKECCDYAGSRGVFLALENHGYLTQTAAEVLAILGAVNHEWLGLNMDIGNFTSDPYRSMEAVMPKVLTIHAKTEVHTEDGSGTELADYPRIMRILREANYRGYISLEYEGKEDARSGVPKHLLQLRRAIGEAWSKPTQP